MKKVKSIILSLVIWLACIGIMFIILLGIIYAIIGILRLFI